MERLKVENHDANGRLITDMSKVELPEDMQRFIGNILYQGMVEA